MTTRGNSVPADVPPHVGTLPETAAARGGCVFEPRSDVWKLREGTYEVTLRFNKLPQSTADFSVAFKMALLWYAENGAAHYVSNLFYRTKALLKFKWGISQKPVLGEL